ncbi:bacterial dolichol-phosphate mannose synthase-like protein [Candidatus Termititenax persephonae]|uniref:Bacterial dolichol-phosphate mannose synthase-like protein n=1 Tax=Candidatus Termititenax persephonae TaxID=2218525 RepID=A0A388TEQ2_9BACT|nr:bacterial dolichol-phosphate mannose synthase-like protein [Candidatus Termititenax persephonae]
MEAVVADIFTAMRGHGYAFEIILVNDASQDNVWHKIEALAAQQDNIIGVCLAKNFGENAALMAGYAQVSGDIVISLDDDGQNPPSEAFTLLNKLNEGYDVVFSAYAKKQHGIFRNIGSRINDFMAEILIGKPRNIQVYSYNAARRYIIDEIVKYSGPYPYITGLFFRTTRNVANVVVEHRKRAHGKSGYSFGKLVGLWLNGFTAFSVKPLRLASLLGLLFSALGVFYMVFLLWERLHNPQMVMGYTSLMAVIIFVGGALMAMLGLIGEYIGRIYISINNAPQYVVKAISRQTNQ